MVAVPIRDVGQAGLYARALVAIARADDEIGLEEGLRLTAYIAERTEAPVRIDDLLLTEPIDPAQLARDLGASAAHPFRSSGVHASTLARMIVVDAIAVLLAKGYVSELEGREVLRFATALGCSLDEVRAMSSHLRLATLEP